jgi:hypothetical protein
MSFLSVRYNQTRSLKRTKRRLVEGYAELRQGFVLHSSAQQLSGDTSDSKRGSPVLGGRALVFHLADSRGVRKPVRATKTLCSAGLSSLSPVAFISVLPGSVARPIRCSRATQMQHVDPWTTGDDYSALHTHDPSPRDMPAHRNSAGTLGIEMPLIPQTSCVFQYVNAPMERTLILALAKIPKNCQLELIEPNR